MDVLVTYDIETTNPVGVRRLARVAAVCLQYGVRVQKSVFECRLTPARYERMLQALRDTIDPKADSVHVYRHEGNLKASRVSLGLPVWRDPDSPWIV